jgi:hypothetical protein
MKEKHIKKPIQVKFIQEKLETEICPLKENPFLLWKMLRLKTKNYQTK